jgi:hypothetical protein
VLLDIGDRLPDGLGIVPELTEPSVTHLANDCSYFPAGVIVVDMDGRPFPADGTLAALLGDHPIDVSGSDAISTLQVIVTTPTVQSLSALAHLRVVAGLAVTVSTGGGSSIPREILRGLLLTALAAEHSSLLLSARSIYRSRATL